MSMLSIIIMRPYYFQITKRIYLQEHGLNKRNAEFVVIKMLFWVYYKKPKRFDWQILSERQKIITTYGSDKSTH